MDYQDSTLQCQECGCDFIFTAGEQEFYAQKGLSNTPKRCPECRKARKRASKPLYDTVCSNCGCETKVPFKPKDDRPVYCKDCFASMKTE